MHSIFFLLCLLIAQPIKAAEFKPEQLDKSYNHDKWGTSSDCIIRDFRAYRSCFDGADDNNGDGTPDLWGVPKWVAYEMKRLEGSCIKTYKRPRTWITDSKLFAKNIMPDDKSYAYPKKFTSSQKDWFARGHLAMKMHAERMGENAGWNTHTFYNAVPQRQLFNAGIWLDLEEKTAAWAQQYEEVWIIDGPIFADKSPHAYIGEEGEFPVAIPDALFKIVIRKGNRPDVPEVMAFIYPQIGAGYYEGKPYDHTRYITSINEIQKMTGLTFLNSVSGNERRMLVEQNSRDIWATNDSDFIRACGSNYNE